MKLHIIDEAERCLKCKKPLCQQGCPIHTPIPQITQLLLENRLMKAGEILFANNPMSAVCSTVCNHENQCEGHCVLGRKCSPIHFSSIENFISDSYLDRMEVPKIEKNGKKVAVIGSGPAGITVAIKLALAGYKVTIFEERSKIGGMLQYGIPEFRLSKSVIDRYKKKYEEKLDQVEADSVIICVSQAPKNKLVLTTDQLKTTEKGLLLTDENCMTTHEGVFAAGDVVQGANTVVHAAEEAKRAAEGMIRYMEREENE